MEAEAEACVCDENKTGGEHRQKPTVREEFNKKEIERLDRHRETRSVWKARRTKKDRDYILQF